MNEKNNIFDGDLKQTEYTTGKKPKGQPEWFEVANYVCFEILNSLLI